MPRTDSNFLGPLITAVLCATLPGCGSPPGVIFTPADSVHEWPPPPDEARIRYLGELRTAGDLKAPVSPGRALEEFIFGKEAAEGMVSPVGVCTDGDDRVYVADSNARVLHVFDLDKRRYSQWKPPKKAPAFVQPIAVAFDAGGERVLVSDAAAGVIFVFDAKGRFDRTIGEGVLQRPCGLAVRPSSGSIFVADASAHQIVELSPDGAEVARIGSRGSGPGRFNFPTAVAFGADGCMYVSDSLNFRVQVFGPDFGFLRVVGGSGDMPGYFSQPKGLGFDPEGHLYVVDAHFEVIQVFDGEGTLLMTFGHEGRGPGEFWLPAGMCGDSKGRLWVADSYNRRVQAFQYLADRSNP